MERVGASGWVSGNSRPKAGPGTHPDAPSASLPGHPQEGVGQPPSARSTCPASESSVASSFSRPSSCAPIGRPLEVCPAGTLIPGQPTTFQAKAKGQVALAVLFVLALKQRKML